MMKSLAFQLALKLPEFTKGILSLDALTLDELTSFEKAFDMLLTCLPTTPIFILIDALDEADPLQLQQAGSDKVNFKPVANRILYALTSLLIPNLPSIRFIFTTRPDVSQRRR